MMRFGILGTCMAAVVACSAIRGATAEELKVGDAAPDFTLKGSDGKTYKLSEFKGKQAVVVAWFPKAFTGGCTKECKSFKEDGEAIRNYDVAYFTASVDTAERNKEFAEYLEVDYPILSDPTKQTALAYGVVTETRQLPFRWTYCIGIDGTILFIDKDVKPEQHGADLAEILDELEVAKDS